MKVSKKMMGIIGGFVATAFVFYGVGTVPASTKVDGKMTSYNELVDHVKEKRATLREVDGKLDESKKELDHINGELRNRQAEFDAAKKLADDRGNIQADVDKKKAEAASKQGEVDKLNADIGAKQAELQKLKEGIVAKKQEPKSLGAGNFVVGADIAAGRYKVTGQSNFIVYTSAGRLKVNTILGGGRIGVDSYVCVLNDEDRIELHGGGSFQPVE